MLNNKSNMRVFAKHGEFVPSWTFHYWFHETVGLSQMVTVKWCTSFHFLWGMWVWKQIVHIEVTAAAVIAWLSTILCAIWFYHITTQDWIVFNLRSIVTCQSSLQKKKQKQN